MRLKNAGCKTSTYPGQNEPQPKRLRIQPETETVIMDFDSEIGNAVTSDVWHNRELVLYFNGHTKTSAIRQFYHENRVLFLRVCNGHTVEWNGSNHVGRLTEGAADAWQELSYNRSKVI